MRRFRAFGVALAEAGHDVGGDRRDFEADEDQQQLDGGGHEQHADCAEDDQREEFALVVDCALHGVERDEQSDENDAADQDMEEDAEGIGLDQAAVGGSGSERQL